jgi:hypothetical protein
MLSLEAELRSDPAIDLLEELREDSVVEINRLRMLPDRVGRAIQMEDTSGK